MNKLVSFFFILIISLPIYTQNERRLLLQHEVNITDCNETDNLNLILLIPQDVEGRQKVLNIKFNIQPVRTFEEKGCKFAEFNLNPRNSTQDRKIFISTLMDIYESDLATIRKLDNAIKSDDSSLSQYLVAEHAIEKDDPLIVNQASKLKAKDAEGTIKKIYNYVTRHIKYTNMSATLGAKHALTQKNGDCSEFSCLFVALCRANNIPTHKVYGYIITSDKKTIKHEWAEYYDVNLGWIPIEPTVKQGQTFNTMENKYVYMTHVRQDKDLGDVSMFRYRFNGKDPKIQKSVVIKDVHPSFVLD